MHLLVIIFIVFLIEYGTLFVTIPQGIVEQEHRMEINVL